MSSGFRATRGGLGAPLPFRIGVDLDGVIFDGDGGLLSGALEGMERLYDLGEVFIITACSPLAFDYQQYRLQVDGVPYTALLCTEEKAEAAVSLRLHLFIDDHQRHCDRVAKALSTCHVMLFNGREIDWQEVVRVAEEMAARFAFQ